MKLKNRFLPALLILSLAVPLHPYAAARNETSENTTTCICSAKTPIDPERSGALWRRSFSGDSISYNSVPVWMGEKLYVVNENRLYELNPSGAILRTLTLAANMNSSCHMQGNGDDLYIPLDGGLMQCVRCSAMRSRWTSEDFGGQSLSTVCCKDGYLYAGTVENPAGKTSGIFYCLDATDGHTVWTYEDLENPGGYYWSGGVVKGNAIYFGGDNGTLVSHSLLTDEVYETRVLTDTGKIRAGIVCDGTDGALFTTSNDGSIHRIETSDDGKITSVLSGKIIPSAKTANCTSTPAIWNNRLYVGSFADTNGYISVLDADTLKAHYHVATGQYKEVKASPLVSTGYATQENHQTVYVYFTCNALPGGIFMIRDSETATNAVLQTLFIPDAKQYCIASVTPDADGTLYYSNDSGTLFAVGAKADSETGTGEVPALPNTGQAQKLKKPSRVKWKKTSGKKKSRTGTLSFRKNEAGAQTLVYVRYGKKGKWKKIKTARRSSCRLTLKSRKKRWIRLRNRLKNVSTKKWQYSTYTKAFRIR